MTATNPHPLANPFNQNRFNNVSYGLPNASQQPVKKVDPKDLTVPDPVSYHDIIANQQRQFEVPNQDIPYFNGPVIAPGFIEDSSLLKLSDGTILDLDKCKIVYDPSTKFKAMGYWNDPNYILPNSHSNEWGKTETIESLIAGLDKSQANSPYDPNLSPESIAYWKRAQEESKKLEQNLTDQQKKLLDDLNSGKMFPLTKLVEEN